MKSTTLAEIVGAFDGFMIDQFGVLIDGSTAYPGAVPALTHLHDAGKEILILTNSGKRAAFNAARISGHGFLAESYQAVVSSGEVARTLIARRIENGELVNPKVWYHADRPDESPLEGLAIELVEQADAADLLVLAGSSLTLSLEGYEALLRPAAGKGVPCLCSNPDFERLVAGGKTFGPGRVAKLYEELGGPVEWVGKPYRLIYDEAYRLMSGIARERVVCVGDSPEHDVAGAQAAGFRTALVRTGIHAEMSDGELRDFCAKAGAVPDFVIPGFSLA